MAGRSPKVEVSEEVEILFQEVEAQIQNLLAKTKPNLKIQVEKDFRGRPVLSLRIRKEGVEFEVMDTLRYPE